MNSQLLKNYLYPFAFGLPRFAGTFSYIALFILSFPMIVLQSVGEQHKGVHLGMIYGLAASISMMVVWALGKYADDQPSEQRHKRMVVFSLGLSLPFLVSLTFSQDYGLIAMIMVAIFLSRILTDASLLTLLAYDNELTPKENYTAALSFHHFLGSMLGTVAFGLFPLKIVFLSLPAISPLAATALGISILGLMGFWGAMGGMTHPRVFPLHQPVKLELSPEMKNFLVARICFLTAMMVIPTFLVFIVQDLMAAQNIKQTAAVLMGCALIGGLLFSGCSGPIVQKLGETTMLFRAGWIIALTAPIFLISTIHNQLLAMASMAIFGAGFSAVMVSGTSLCVKLVSQAGIPGRYMALVTASTFLSQLFASVLGGFLLDSLNRLGHHWGYWGLLVMVELFFAMGALYLKKI